MERPGEAPRIDTTGLGHGSSGIGTCYRIRARRVPGANPALENDLDVERRAVRFQPRGPRLLRGTGYPHDTFTKLRNEDPVYRWTETDGTYARTVLAGSAEEANELDDWLSGYGRQPVERWPDRAVFLLLGVLLGSVIAAVWTRAEVSGEKQECLQHLVSCADDLEENEARVAEGVKAIRAYGDRVVECEQSICEANGWFPPMDQWHAGDE